MRATILRALAQPIEDVKVGAERLEPFHRSVVVARRAQVTLDMADRALEAASLGIALLEIYVRARDEESGP